MKTDIEIYLNTLLKEILILNIEGRGLTCLPNLTSFIKLKELYCSDNLLTSLSSDLPQGLEILYCSHNQLISLNDLTKLTNLKKLYCNNNQLTSLPNDLPQGLKILYCYNNQLTSLPNDLPQGLEILYCSNNQLTSLTNLIRLNNLKELYCHKNQLTYLPSVLSQTLEKLFCFDNYLTNLPILPEKLLYIIYWNNPICTILDKNYNTLIKVKENILILNIFRCLYYSLQFKKQFIKWLWKSREKNIRLKYHPNYLLENLKENTDLEEFLNNWK